MGLIKTIIVIVFLILGWYLISPLFSNIELNEESPLITDQLEKMSLEEKKEFETQTEEMKNEMILMADEMPKAEIISQGIFKPRAHEVKGKAILIEAEQKILRFEKFETINGPNLHIYLSTTLGEEDYIDLGKIKATNGNVNYEIPKGTDTEKYNKVLIWCVPFKVLFSYAELK